MMKSTEAYEQYLEARRTRREDRDYAAYERLRQRENAADKMIGELIRDGKTVLYVYPVGGRYREGSRHDLISFLIRNRYA